MSAKPWSDEDIATACSLWRQGWSSGEIGRKINRSRNSVIGKVCRLGLQRGQRGVWISRRPSPPKAIAICAAKRPPRVAAQTLVATPLPPPHPEDRIPGVPILEITDDQCRWPVSHTGPAHMCGKDRERPSAYCAAHARRAAPGDRDTRAAKARSADRYTLRQLDRGVIA